MEDATPPVAGVDRVVRSDDNVVGAGAIAGALGSVPSVTISQTRISH